MMHVKYKEYKNSNIYWVGDIPSHWEVNPVKHHFFSKKQVAGNLADNYQRLALTLNGVIKRSKYDAEGLQPEKFETYQIVRKKSLIFKLIDLENIKTSRVGLSKWDGLVSPAYIILFSNGNILPSYAEKYFLNMWHEHIFNQLGSVGVRSNLNKEDVLNLPIIKPSLEEQKKIANYLDKKTAKIDATIAKNEELLRLLEEKRVALINQVVTKGLNPNVVMKDSGVEWMGEIPEQWDVINLKKCCETITDGSHFSPETTSEGKYYITVRDVGKDSIDFDNAPKISVEDYNTLKRNGCEPKKGDVLLSKDGTIGKCIIVNETDFVILSSLGLLRPNNLIESEYLRYYLLSDINVKQMYSHIRGSAIKRLTISIIKELLLICPPLNEQEDIINYLNPKISRINNTINKIQDNINLLEEYKTSLIHHVVTGKIDVRGEEI